jgi:hypothetical protein
MYSKRDHPPLFLLVIGAGGGQFFQGIFLVDGHDAGAGFVGRAVQGDGQAELLRLVGQTPDLRGQPAGGNGDFARAHLAAPRRVEDAQGLASRLS